MWKNIFLHVISSKSAGYRNKTKAFRNACTPVLNHSEYLAVGSQNFHIFVIGSPVQEPSSV